MKKNVHFKGKPLFSGLIAAQFCPYLNVRLALQTAAGGEEKERVLMTDQYCLSVHVKCFGDHNSSGDSCQEVGSSLLQE